MKLVIDIDDKIYNTIKNSTFFIKGGRGSGRTIEYNALKPIYDGTPLPKEHGRLIDADALCDYFWDNRSKLYTHKDLRIVIDNAPTIIEADKENAE